MKLRRGVLLFLLFVVLTTRVVAQAPIHTIYLPAVIYPPMDGTMGLWSYVDPLETDNRDENPSFETGTVGWTNAGLAAMAQSAAEQKFGVYSLACLANSQFDHAFSEPAGFTPAATIAVTAWVRTTSSDVGLWIQSRPSGDLIGSDLHSGGGGWERLTVTGALTAAETVARIQIRDDRAAGWDTYYVDGVQAEELGYATTYCDGDQPGCEWNGAAHASTSTRSALSRAGGVVINFEDLSFDIGGMFGAGMSPITVNIDPFAILPGAEINSIKTDARTFTLSGWVSGTSLADLHAKRQAIIDALKPNAVPNNQPVLLRYTGAAITKEIAATYEAGLAGTIRGEFPCLEQNFVLRFLATDPNWYEIGNSAAVLDIGDGPIFRNISRRTRENGWDNLGPPAAGPPAVYNGVESFTLGQDRILYFGGSYADYNNNVNMDRVGSYNAITGAFAALGTGTNVGITFDMVTAPDGRIFACGSWNVMGGVPNTAYVAVWDPVGLAWSALGGTGLNDWARGMAVAQNGHIIIVGRFTDVAGGPVGTYNRIIDYDPIADTFAAVGTGLNNDTYDVAIDALTGDFVVCGDFTTAGGNANNRIARWDGAWAANSFGTGLSARGRTVISRSNGRIIVGGEFVTADGQTVNFIAEWNDSTFISLAGGLNGHVYTLSEEAPDGTVFAGGLFTLSASGLLFVDRAGKWNGSSWAHIDIDFPGAPTVQRLFVGIVDPVLASKYDVWLGTAINAASDHSGLVVVTNDGTEDAFPLISISRTGGTTARLVQIRNEILGLELPFDYSLVDGETLEIDLRPSQKSIVSNYYGSRLDALLTNADLGTWRLQSGPNTISCLIIVTGAPTIVGTMQWRDPYWSVD